MPYIGKQLSNGNYLKLDDISSGFNNSTTTFSLTNGGSAYYPGSEFSVLVSVGGSIKEPETAYQINNDQITFSDAPASSEGFFCIVLGEALGINVPADNTVNGAKLSKPFNYDGGLLYLDDINNRVGINSTSPSVALDVVGDLNVSGNISGIGGTLGGSLLGNVYASSGISTFNDLLINGDLTVQGDTTTLNTTLRNVELLRVSAASTLPAGIITQTGSGNILELYDGTTEKFHVDSDGTTTHGTLQVDGVEGGSAQIRIRADQGDDNNDTYRLLVEDGGTGLKIQGYDGSFQTRITLDTSGNVGIGTDDPSKLLELSAANPTINVKATANNDASLEFIESTSANFGSTGTNGFRLRYDGGDNRFYIASGANATVNNVVSIDRDTGAFGLGLDAPTARLQVNGTSNGLQARFGGAGTGLGVSCFQKTNNNAGVKFIAQDGTHGTFSFETAGSEALRIASDGDVIIGGSSDAGYANYADNLTIHGTSNEGITIRSGTTSQGAIYFSDTTGTGSGTYEGSVIYDHKDNYISLATNHVERLRIDLDGKVGIGLTDPAGLLEIEGNESSTTQFSGLDGLRIHNANGAAHGVTADMYFTAGTGSTNRGAAIGVEYTSAASGNDLYFATNAGNVTSTNTLTERLRITSAGNVSIHSGAYSGGGAAPQLYVSGTGGRQVKIHNSNAGTSSLQITNGTTGEGEDAGTQLFTQGSTGDFFIYNAFATGDVAFGTRPSGGSTTERLRITSAGQVSISGAGTTFGNNTLLNIAPANRTTAFDASDGDTWHDVVLLQGGSATNNAVGIAFELKNNGAYHKNAGTGICAVKNGTNSDYGSDLVFITRPQSAVAAERLRIKSSGEVAISNFGNTTPGLSTNADDLVIGFGTQSGETGMTMFSTTASGIRFNDNDGTDAAIEYGHSAREMRFNAANANRLTFGINAESSPVFNMGVSSGDANNHNKGDRTSVKVGDYLYIESATGSGHNTRAGIGYNCYFHSLETFYCGTNAPNSGDNRPAAYGMAYGNHYFYSDASNTAHASQAELTMSRVMEILRDGDVKITDGDLIMGTAGHGINFSQTANAGNSASMTSELFDDYEWGTWTPVNQYQTVASRRDCRYIKVGDMVTVSFDITCGSSPSGGSQTGGYIEGLPFTSVSSSPGGRPGSLKMFDSYNGPASSLTNECWMYCGGSGTVLYIVYNDQDGRVITRAESAGKRILGQFTYLAA